MPGTRALCAAAARTRGRGTRPPQASHGDAPLLTPPSPLAPLAQLFNCEKGRKLLAELLPLWPPVVVWSTLHSFLQQLPECLATSPSALADVPTLASNLASLPKNLVPEQSAKLLEATIAHGKGTLKSALERSDVTALLLGVLCCTGIAEACPGPLGAFYGALLPIAAEVRTPGPQPARRASRVAAPSAARAVAGACAPPDLCSVCLAARASPPGRGAVGAAQRAAPRRDRRAPAAAAGRHGRPRPRRRRRGVPAGVRGLWQAAHRADGGRRRLSRQGGFAGGFWGRGSGGMRRRARVCVHAEDSSVGDEGGGKGRLWPGSGGGWELERRSGCRPRSSIVLP